MKVPHYKIPATCEEVMIDMPEIDLSGVVTDVALEAIESGDLSRPFWADPKGGLAILKLLKEKKIDGNLFTTAHLFWNTIHRIDSKERYRVVKLDSEEGENIIRDAFLKSILYCFSKFKDNVLRRPSLLEKQFLILSDRKPNPKHHRITSRILRCSGETVIVVPFSFFQETLGIQEDPIRLIPSYGLTTFDNLAEQVGNNSRAFSLHGSPDGSKLDEIHGATISEAENFSSQHDFLHAAVVGAIRPDAREMILQFRKALLEAEEISKTSKGRFLEVANKIADFAFPPTTSTYGVPIPTEYWLSDIVNKFCEKIYFDIPSLFEAFEKLNFCPPMLPQTDKIQIFADRIQTERLLNYVERFPKLSFIWIDSLAKRYANLFEHYNITDSLFMNIFCKLKARQQLALLQGPNRTTVLNLMCSSEMSTHEIFANCENNYPVFCQFFEEVGLNATDYCSEENFPFKKDVCFDSSYQQSENIVNAWIEAAKTYMEPASPSKMQRTS